MVVRYSFEPNDFARTVFRLDKNRPRYYGSGMTGLLEKIMGAEAYDKLMVAQDPLCGGAVTGTVRIVTNPEETDPNKRESREIGIITRLGNRPSPQRFRRNSGFNL